MTSDDSPRLKTGDLIVDPERGEIRNLRGESTRLGLVNMNVLMLLLSRSGRVVSRTEIFDTVWKNQIVGDDVLTRAISDIRAEVGRLSTLGEPIETLRKRGYRWTAAVEPLAASLGAVEPPAENPVPGVAPPAEPRPEAARSRSLIVRAGRGVVYAAALLLLASLGAWLMSETARPGRHIVAVLPTTGLARSEIVPGIEQQLSEFLIQLERIDVLSRSAVESRPSNPFPYFYYEFGANWLVESELRGLSSRKAALTITVVDARTGIVLLRSTLTFSDDAPPSAAALDTAFAALEEFFESQTDR